MLSALRTFLEWVSRGVVLKRRLPARFGERRVFVTPDSRLGYWKRDMDRVESDLLKWADEFVVEGTCVWDVGANVGLFAVASAIRAGSDGHIVALEPDLKLASLLHRSVLFGQTGDEANVTVLPVAASERSELVRLAVAARGRSSNFVRKFGGSTQSGGTRREQQVLAISLDWLAKLAPPPDVLKLDVEGAEAAVLEGGIEVIRRHRPVILVEVYERNQEKVSEVLSDADYRFYDLSLDPEDRKPLTSPVMNTLCQPR